MKITVIIQGFKDRGFFDQSIKSALNQGFEDFEVVLSSDGNPDLKSYADKYGIRFILSQPMNHSGSVNNAIKNTDSEWIKVLDDDDLIKPDFLQNVWDNRHKGDLLHGDAILLKDDQLASYKGKEITIKSLLPIGINPINWATVAFSREAFNAVGGFDRRVHYGNDYDLYLNFLNHGFKIGYVNKIMGVYRIHPNQLTKACIHYKEVEKQYLAKKYDKLIKL